MKKTQESFIVAGDINSLSEHFFSALSNLISLIVTCSSAADTARTVMLILHYDNSHSNVPQYCVTRTRPTRYSSPLYAKMCSPDPKGSEKSSQGSIDIFLLRLL
jgi:hypothetical protein